MARVKTFSLIMIVVLMLAAVAWSISTVQPGFAAQLNQDTVQFVDNFTSDATTSPSIACDGCSGGGSGPF